MPDRTINPERTIRQHDTPDEYKYKYVADVSTVSSFTFQVTAQNDAHIALSADGKGPDDKHYEIVIGGWDDTKSVIRNENQGKELVEVKGGWLRGKDGFFWISWGDGTLRVGNGKEVGRSQQGLGRTPWLALATVLAACARLSPRGVSVCIAVRVCCRWARAARS